MSGLPNGFLNYNSRILKMDNEIFSQAIYIRTVEEELFKIFESGKISGTIHASIGQEMSALAVCQPLLQSDFVFSGHRCHAHFLALTGDDEGLVGELLGRKSGVCGGVGGSQHLCVKGRFYSNGIQGGILPVALGHAWANKFRGLGGIGVAFIGDGTFGQGIVYESLNIMSLKGIPLLTVVENNQYAQSTPVAANLSGSIPSRFRSFSIPVYEANTWDISDLIEKAKSAITYVRESSAPAALVIDTYRLCSHSKNDDSRSAEEVEHYAKLDPINIWATDNPQAYLSLKNGFRDRVSTIIKALQGDSFTDFKTYARTGSSQARKTLKWTSFSLPEKSETMAQSLNSTFHQLMEAYPTSLFIGEDVASPYGGAFKVARGLSEKFPERVFSTPISEQAITGISNGLAIGGCRPILELMFGDFLTLSCDQLINHASKFRHMYNHQVTCPIVLRTPMGGKRGYGPTHSQTLEKIVCGIDNIKVVALNILLSPMDLYSIILSEEEDPIVVIENKADYSRLVRWGEYNNINHYYYLKSTSRYPAVLLSPISEEPDVSIITYGGNVDMVLRASDHLFSDHEIISEILVLTTISPIDPSELEVRGRRIYIVEEGSVGYGVGSEIIANLSERGSRFDKIHRIGSSALPIPASRELEEQALVSVEKIVEVIADV